MQGFFYTFTSMLFAFISDIHEDISGLDKAMGFIKKRQVDRIICLGDIVGFNPIYFGHGKLRDANACIDIVREQCDFVVAGNHDLAACGTNPSYSESLGLPKNYFELPEEQQTEIGLEKFWSYKDQKANLTSENLNFFKSLNTHKIIEAEDFKIFISHYPFPDFSGLRSSFISSSTELSAHFNYLKTHECLFSFSAHSHIEGFLWATQDNLSNIGFIKKTVPKQTSWIDIPCITFGKKESGFLLFDTNNLEIEAIALKQV
jgi:predicted phosphodiesterase